MLIFLLLQLNSLFKLLSKLADLEENDSGVVQLAYTVSPTICRPVTSAYMSLRHMEDLKKIRPVILFLIENYSEMFSPIRIPSKPQEVKPLPIVETVEAERKLSDMMATAMVIDVAPKIEEPKVPDDKISLPFIKPNLLVMIPTLQTSESLALPEAEPETDKAIVATPFQPYSDTEWKV